MSLINKININKDDNFDVDYKVNNDNSIILFSKDNQKKNTDVWKSLSAKQQLNKEKTLIIIEKIKFIKSERDYIIEAIDEIKTNWKSILETCLYMVNMNAINSIYNYIYKKKIESIIYPSNHKLIFNTFNYFNLKDTKVIILGIEPYISGDISDGLAYSTINSTKCPHMLNNIYSELQNEYFNKNNNEFFMLKNLKSWAQQGVLLLNMYLTSIKNIRIHHKSYWADFNKTIIHIINQRCNNCVFMLFGFEAKKLSKIIDRKKHLVIECAHPSPLSANRGGWFYQSQFRLCNLYLNTKKKKEIDWFKI